MEQPQDAGDVRLGTVLHRFFTTIDPADNEPETLGGTPDVVIYRDGELTESQAGRTLTVDFDGRTGLNYLIVDTSADVFYQVGSEYHVVVSSGTVNTVSWVNKVILRFSIGKQPYTYGIPMALPGQLPTLAGGGAGLATTANIFAAAHVGPISDATPTTTEIDLHGSYFVNANDHYLGQQVVAMSGNARPQVAVIEDQVGLTLTLNPGFRDAPANGDIVMILAR